MDAAVAGGERHRAAAQRVEHLGQAALPRAQRRERGVGPGLGIERHRHADRAPAGALDHGQALEQIVDLILADLERQDVAVDLAGPLEVADAVAVQDDAVEPQRRVGGGIAEPLGVATARQRGGRQQGDEDRRERAGDHGRSMRRRSRAVHG
ncbi:MAG: hypothetical protein IPL61_35770 [Myxococcales bacterium]|nr:hypothetical protein [Myxococcales bacterium]